MLSIRSGQYPNYSVNSAEVDGSDAQFACMQVLPYNYIVTRKQDNISPDGGNYGIDKNARKQPSPIGDDDSLLAEDELRAFLSCIPTWFVFSTMPRRAFSR